MPTKAELSFLYKAASLIESDVFHGYSALWTLR